MSHRIVQVAELVREELNNVLLTEVDFPKGCLATIVRVDISKDLRHAKVYFSVIPAKFTKKVLNTLNKNAGNIQFLLNKKLSLKPLPRLRFLIDETEKEAMEIDSLIAEGLRDIERDNNLD